MKSFTPELKKTPAQGRVSFRRSRQGRSRDLGKPDHRRALRGRHAILSRHLANVMLKQAGLPKQF
jgi:hypothetical protein